MNKQLLFFVDEGGFDDFTPLFLSMGFDVDFEDSQRKAVQLAKKNRYDIFRNPLFTHLAIFPATPSSPLGG
jgi:hypothetical protein